MFLVRAREMICIIGLIDHYHKQVVYNSKYLNVSVHLT